MFRIARGWRAAWTSFASGSSTAAARSSTRSRSHRPLRSCRRSIPSRYELTLIAIAQDGRWRLGAPGMLPASAVKGEEVTLPAVPGARTLLSVASGAAAAQLDVILPIVHGSGGEDGSLQGFLELAGVPVRRRRRARLRAPDGQGGVEAPARGGGHPGGAVDHGAAHELAANPKAVVERVAARDRAALLREARELGLVGGHPQGEDARRAARRRCATPSATTRSCWSSRP